MAATISNPTQLQLSINKNNWENIKTSRLIYFIDYDDMNCYIKRILKAKTFDEFFEIAFFNYSSIKGSHNILIDEIENISIMKQNAFISWFKDNYDADIIEKFTQYGFTNMIDSVIYLVSRKNHTFENRYGWKYKEIEEKMRKDVLEKLHSISC